MSVAISANYSLQAFLPAIDTKGFSSGELASVRRAADKTKQFLGDVVKGVRTVTRSPITWAIIGAIASTEVGAPVAAALTVAIGYAEAVCAFVDKFAGPIADLFREILGVAEDVYSFFVGIFGESPKDKKARVNRAVYDTAEREVIVSVEETLRLAMSGDAAAAARMDAVALQSDERITRYRERVRSSVTHYDPRLQEAMVKHLLSSPPPSLAAAAEAGRRWRAFVAQRRIDADNAARAAVREAYAKASKSKWVTKTWDQEALVGSTGALLKEYDVFVRNASWLGDLSARVGSSPGRAGWSASRKWDDKMAALVRSSPESVMTQGGTYRKRGTSLAEHRKQYWEQLRNAERALLLMQAGEYLSADVLFGAPDARIGWKDSDFPPGVAQLLHKWNARLSYLANSLRREMFRAWPDGYAAPAEVKRSLASAGWTGPFLSRIIDEELAKAAEARQELIGGLVEQAVAAAELPPSEPARGKLAAPFVSGGGAVLEGSWWQDPERGEFGVVVSSSLELTSGYWVRA